MNLSWKIVLAICVFSLNLFSAEIYVSPSGSDSTGIGSIGSPFQTINHALGIVHQGDTIFLREGVYEEAVRIRIPGITLQAFEGETVSIQTPVNDENIEVTIILDVDSDGALLRNLDISGGYYYGLMTFTRWDWGDPEDRSGASEILVENCKIHDTGRDCIKITPGCDDIVISQCEIYNSGARYDENAEGIDVVNGDRIVVRDCYIHDTATTGIYLKGGCIDGVVERTWVENCGGLGIAAGFDTSPEYFDLSVNPERYENINGIVRNCIVVNTYYAGIAMYAALDVKILNNTIVDTASGGQSPIYFGVTLQDWEVDEDPGDAYGYRPSSLNPLILNNIVYQSEDFNAPFVSVRTFYHESLGRINGLQGMPVMDNNCYFKNGGMSYFEDNRPDSLLEEGTLNEWQDHIVGDLHSLSDNPQLDSEFHLTQSSPCIDAGYSTTDVTDDYDSEDRSGSYDIGADETNGEQVVSGEKYYLPHIADDNYLTYLQVVNFGDTELSYQLILYDEEGTGTYSFNYLIPVKSVELINLNELNSSCGSGTILHLEGNGLYKLVFINSAGGMAEFIINSLSSGKLIHSYPNYNPDVTWKGIACMNTGNSDTSVLIKAYKNGFLIGEEIQNISNHKRLVGLLGRHGNFLKDLELEDIEIVTVESSENWLTGINISGNPEQTILLFTPSVHTDK